MAFDQKTRNLLQRTVSACRRILDREFTAQLQELYGIQPDGALVALAALDHLGDEELEVARLLRERINHLEGSAAADALTRKTAKAEHVARVIREQAFTVLNRLAALRMCEERGLVLECVRQGVNSEGFQLFKSSAGSALGATNDAYRDYLHCLFDELSVDLGVLFDRFSPLAILFPRSDTLAEVIRELNGSGKAAEREVLSAEQFGEIWQADETIGWIYQYYNDENERKQMREESSAPRNSRELAVRNQFFTPRYVVEFLTDNTLGRIWYEMTRGETKLKEQCRYLVRRPNEIFLNPGQTAPEQPKQDNLSQEDLLKQPVHIPHRPLKDPRTILMLDPACGSMHFGLYAFDLFEVIYDEAWALEEKLGADALSRPPGMKSLHATYAGKDTFLKDVPRLIIEHNLHGIDIDPRCAQIAGLSLWLRAQKAWQRLGLKPAERPAIKRSNIVCAEPMPGEKELLREFVEREFPAEERNVFLILLESIFDKMQLAGEAGSLLKIEEEIRSAINEGRKTWETIQSKPRELFNTEELNAVRRQSELTLMEQAVSYLGDESTQLVDTFFARIEERIYAALRDYAEQAENGGGFQRRLFAEDAARGFAFIDVCRKRYDVALMNPPFGEVPTSVADYNSDRYPHWIDNILCAFIARGWQMTEAQGTVGVIFDRTAIVKSSYEDFRRHVLLATNRISALADTGWEVLDANVETTCLALARLPEEQTSLFFDVRRMSPDEKGSALNSFLGHSQAATLAEGITLAWPLSFNRLPNAVLGYDFPEFLKRAFSAFAGLGDSGFTAYQGHALEAEVHYRAWWELPHPTPQTPLSDWTFAFKGGDYSPFYLVPSDVAFYGTRGSRVPDSTANVLRNLDFQQLPGVAFGKRGEFLDAQPLPRGSIFTHEGHAIPSLSAHDSWFVLAVLNTAFFSVAVNTFCGQHKTSGYVNLFPLARFDAVQRAQLAKLAKAIHDKKAGWYRGEERNPHFSVVYLAESTRRHRSLAELIRFSLSEVKASDDFVKEAEHTIEETIRSAYQLTDSEQEWVERGCKSRPRDATWYDRKEISSANAITELAGSHVSYWLGIAFGRWDILYATGEQTAPELPDPFAPLPVCPPGQLQNAQGLPARPEDVPAAYPVRIPWDGILVDDPNHPLDIERRVREVIGIIWSGKEGGPTADAIEHEACEILDVKSLRDYFRKPAGFFADHLKRYSKSRRQAPIYWPLSTASGSYTVWIYYHRLTPDTLYKCVQQFVNPKLGDVEKELTYLRTALAANEGGAKERKRIEDLETLRRELIDLRTELEQWAPKWKPNLNDGVLITAAPLYKLFRLTKWQKDLKACWHSMEKGDYDWAHLAYALWPDRVREKCKRDRSLAIGHGLEEICEVKAPMKKPKKVKRPPAVRAPELEISE